MKSLQKFLAVSVVLALLPQVAFGYIATSWAATSTSQGWVFPLAINGTFQSVTAKNFIATTTTPSIFPTFFFTNATGTAFSTASLNISGITGVNGNCLHVDTVGHVTGTGSDCASGGMSFSWPWTKQADGSQATSTLMSFIGGLESGASSTLTNLISTTQTAGNNSTKVATTAYVDAAVTASNPAVAVQYATTAAGDTSALTYNNGVSGIGATLTGVNNATTAIDGHTFVVGDVGVTRILVKNDTQSPSGAFNGVYLFTALHTVGTGDIFTRALDYDMPSDINNTGSIPVVSGTTNTATSWLLTSNVATVGTSPLTYIQFSINPTTQVTTSRALTMNGTSNQITSSAGSQDLSADRTWTFSIPSPFRIGTASTTVLDAGNAFFGQTATSSFNGTGALFVVGSTTLQSFTASQGTITSATSTNDTSQHYLATGSSTFQGITVSSCTGCSSGGGATEYYATTTTTRYMAKTLNLNSGDLVEMKATAQDGAPGFGNLTYRISSPWQTSTTTIINQGNTTGDMPSTYIFPFLATTTETVTFAYLGSNQNNQFVLTVYSNTYGNQF